MRRKTDIQNYTILAAAFFFMLVSVAYYFVHDQKSNQTPVAAIENFGAQFSDYEVFTPAKEIPALRIYTMSDEEKSWSSAMTANWQFVNIWATWCPPCIVEIPSLIALNDHFKDDSRFDIAFLSIDFPQDGRMLLEKMHQKDMRFNDLEGGGYYARDINIWNSLGIDGVPTTFLVDGDGRIHAAFMGDIDWNQKETLEFISILINHSE